MFRTLDPVFSHLREMKRRGDLAVCTMGDLADHFDAAGTTGMKPGSAS
jgi:hypothetical protein